MSQSVAKAGLAGRVLLLFCHDPKPMPMVHYEEGTALDSLMSVFPGFVEQVRGKRVIDFGCGLGYQTTALAEAGAASVTGVENNGDLAAKAQARVDERGLSDKARVAPSLDGESADVIVSQNSFEHFSDPAGVLQAWKGALAPGGAIYVTFGPLWYAPLGSHMGFFCRLPWVNLLFPERTVIAVRSRYRSDGASNYREAGLGEMSLEKFERVVRESGLQVRWKRYDCVKRATFLRDIPVLRELFVNRVSCVLTA